MLPSCALFTVDSLPAALIEGITEKGKQNKILKKKVNGVKVFELIKYVPYFIEYNVHTSIVRT
jgi:hypothetical protein